MNRNLAKTNVKQALVVIAEDHAIMTTKPFGRPRKWTDPIEFSQLVDSYFDEMVRGDIPTISGLAVYLDSDRKTLLNYAKRDDFFRTIQRARARCEAALETRGLLGGLNPALTIFSLKNNYGWVDRSEVDQNLKVVTPILSGMAKDDKQVTDVHSDADNA